MLPQISVDLFRTCPTSIRQYRKMWMRTRMFYTTISWRFVSIDQFTVNINCLNYNVSEFDPSFPPPLSSSSSSSSSSSPPSRPPPTTLPPSSLPCYSRHYYHHHFYPHYRPPPSHHHCCCYLCHHHQQQQRINLYYFRGIIQNALLNEKKSKL